MTNQSIIGRFSAEDPIRDKFNWYGYCGGNPVNFIDPRGLFPWDAADDDWLPLVNTVMNAGCSLTWNPPRQVGSAGSSTTVSLWGERVNFYTGSDGVRINSNNRKEVRADVFFNTIVESAGGSMTFVGGHPAFQDMAARNRHTYVKMFVSESSEHWNGNIFRSRINSEGVLRENTRWGLRFATFGGTRIYDNTLQIVANVANDINFDNTVFKQFIISGDCAIRRLIAAQAYARNQEGWLYASLLVPGVWGPHVSNNITSGLLHAAGIHPGSINLRALGWDFPTPLSFFGGVRECDC